MNKTSLYQLTIIIPVYNEEENIYNTGNKISDFLQQASLKACALFVNDGSKDNSLQKILEVCNHNKDLYYISFEKNEGLSTAIKAGIDETESPYVGYIDADLQTAPDDFNLLLQYITDYELVTGIRTNRKDSLYKKMQSKIANGFRRMIIHDGITDTGCPLKILHTDFAKRIPFFTGMHRFIPALILLQNGRIKQIPVRHFPRTAGKSKYHLWNRLISPFIDCFAYQWMKKRYIHYHIIGNNLK